MGNMRPDRLRDLLDTVLKTLDEGLDERPVTSRAYLNATDFEYLVASGLGEIQRRSGASFCSSASPGVSRERCRTRGRGQVTHRWRVGVG